MCDKHTQFTISIQVKINTDKTGNGIQSLCSRIIYAYDKAEREGELNAMYSVILTVWILGACFISFASFFFGLWKVCAGKT